MSKKPETTEFATSAYFQKFLKEAIDEQDLTKVQFAKAAGVGSGVIIRATLYQCVPSIKSLVKLADYLHVPIMYMFGKTDERYFEPAREPSNFFIRLELWLILCLLLPTPCMSGYERKHCRHWTICWNCPSTLTFRWTTC